MAIFLASAIMQKVEFPIILFVDKVFQSHFNYISGMAKKVPMKS